MRRRPPPSRREPRWSASGAAGRALDHDHPDLADVYRLTVNPQEPDEYRLDGRWVPFVKRTVAIQVKTGASGPPASVSREMWLQKRQHPYRTPLQMLKASVPLLRAAYGRLDPKWGEVNRLRRGKLDLPLDGAPTPSARSMDGSIRMDACAA